MTEEEKFFAWLDGELTGAEADEMEARVGSDPQLAELAERHRAMQARLKGTFDKVAAAAMPGRLVAAATADSGPSVVDLAGARERDPARRFAGVPQWASIAATLVLGILVGSQLPGGDDGPVEIRNGAIYAAGELDQALDTQLASAPSEGAVRIGLTYRDRTGAICRTFTGNAATGLACRDESRWRMRGLFPAGEGQEAEYRMAAGMDPALATLVDSTLSGEPMDATEEAAARERDWR